MSLGNQFWDRETQQLITQKDMDRIIASEELAISSVSYLSV